MYSGFVFTYTGKDALALMGTQGVRYAAEMSDGTGFVAFDSEDDIGEGTAAVGGWIVTTMEPHPDYPPSWPQNPKGPKRQIATGDERFILYPAYQRQFVPVPRAGCWVTDGVRLMLLVEVGPEYDSQIENIWEGTVVNYEDARLVRA